MYLYELNPYHSIYLKPEKEKIEREASKLNAGEKEPEREKENKGDSFFVGGTTWNFVALVRKWEMLAAIRVKRATVKTNKEKEHVGRLIPQ